MKSRFIVLILLSCLTSCSYLTKQGRQEHAYRSYIRKSSVVRAKQQRKFKFRTPEMAIRKDAPSMTTTNSESPQSMTASPTVTTTSESPQSMTAAPNPEQSPPPPN